MNKEYISLLKRMDNADLELNLNRELANGSNMARWKIMTICAILVDRVYTHHRIRLTKTDISDVVVSLFLFIKNKKKVSLNTVNSHIRKEINIISRHFPIYSITEGFDEDEHSVFYMEHIFQSEDFDLENKVFAERAAAHMYKLLPYHLRPIFSFYLDTGMLLTDYLDPVDKVIVLLATKELGVSNLNADKASIFPNSVKGKSLFIGDLAQRSPELLVLLLLLGDVEKLALFTEIFGGGNFEVPQTNTMLRELEESSIAAKSIESNRATYNSSFVANLIQNFNYSEKPLAGSLNEFFEKVLTAEYDMYMRSLDKLGNKFDNGSIGPSQFFRLANTELENSIGMLERIKKLTEMV